jgi:hypothetical protein
MYLKKKEKSGQEKRRNKKKTQSCEKSFSEKTQQTVTPLFIVQI